MLSRILIVGFLSILSTTSFADSHWHSSNIKSIYPLGDGDFVLTFDTDSADCTSTSSPKYHYVRVGENGVTKEGINQMYSLAMSAAMTDKTVYIYFNDAADCLVNRMFVSF